MLSNREIGRPKIFPIILCFLSLWSLSRGVIENCKEYKDIDKEGLKAICRECDTGFYLAHSSSE